MTPELIGILAVGATLIGLAGHNDWRCLLKRCGWKSARHPASARRVNGDVSEPQGRAGPRRAHVPKGRIRLKEAIQG